MKKSLGALCALALLVCALPANAEVPAFPDCQGYGCGTTCGAGPVRGSATNLCKVTNLSASVVNDGSCGAGCYSGSLPYCITVAAPLTVVFEVSGVIPIKGDLNINKQYVTIAGETAPAPGIALQQTRMVVSGSDVCVRHLSLWAGSEAGSPSCNLRDNLLLSGSRVAMSNMEFAFGVDENVDIYNSPHNVTIQSSIIAKGLMLSCHTDTSGNLEPHSMGILLGDNADYLSIHHNLLSSNNQRNPRTKANHLQWSNNIVYNWGQISAQQTSATGASTYDWINNYYKVGPETDDMQLGYYSAPPTSDSRYYLNGNVWDDGSITVADWTRVDANTLASHYGAAAAQLRPQYPLVSASAAATYAQLIENEGNVGPFPYYRRISRLEPATSIIAEVKSRTGKLVDCVTGCTHQWAGSWPARAQNRRALEAPAGKDVVMTSGYTALEEWLHDFQRDAVYGGQVPTPTPSPEPTLTPAPTATPAPTPTPTKPKRPGKR